MATAVSPAAYTTMALLALAASSYAAQASSGINNPRAHRVENLHTPFSIKVSEYERRDM
jgi:hypothetical protein